MTWTFLVPSTDIPQDSIEKAKNSLRQGKDCTAIVKKRTCVRNSALHRPEEPLRSWTQHSYQQIIREEPTSAKHMCVTKKTNRRPHALHVAAGAATFLANVTSTSRTSRSPSSTLVPSSSSSASPMISPRPFHLKAEAEPSASSSVSSVGATTSATAPTPNERFHIASCCRNRHRTSLLVVSPPLRRQKSVAFSTATVVETVTPSSAMTNERKDELWYDHDTLESFKKAARRDGKAHRKRRRQPLLLSSSSLSAASPDDDSASSSSSDDDDTAPDSHRGLEHRISLERQRNRCVAQRAILECARRLATSSPSSPDSSSNRPTSAIPIDADVHLALVSSKVTRWSREVALSTGRNDFYAAYPEVATTPGNANGCPRGLTLEQINARYPFPMSFNKKVGPATTDAATTKTPTSAAPTATADDVVVADLGPIPTKFNTFLIQENDSDDEHRRRLAKKRRMGEGASLSYHVKKRG